MGRFDSFAPAHSALAGLCLWQIPFVASQATQVPGLRPLCSLTPGYYLSPRRGFGLAAREFWNHLTPALSPVLSGRRSRPIFLVATARILC